MIFTLLNAIAVVIDIYVINHELRYYIEARTLRGRLIHGIIFIVFNLFFWYTLKSVVTDFFLFYLRYK